MPTELRHIESQWNENVVPSILEQYKDSEKWQALLKSAIDGFQVGEDAVDEFTRLLDFKSSMPTGGQLDWLAGLVNVRRMPGEVDTSLFTRFIMTLGKKDAGTPNAVIRSAAILSGDNAPQYMDEADCTFIVYDGPVYEHRGENDDVLIKDPGVKQLTRSQVRKLAPAGVLGLPGAAVKTGDGTLLADANGKLILMVADDDALDDGGVLVTELDEPIITEDGDNLATE